MSTRIAAGSPLVRRGAVVVAATAAAFLLAACSSSDGDFAEDGADASYASSDDMSRGGEGAEAFASDSEASADQAADAADDRSLIITGSMYITVDDPIDAANEAAQVVRDAGGRVDSRSETRPRDNDGGSAWMTLRIPADALEQVAAELRDLGTVDEYSTTSQDVSTEVTDLEAQISTLRASTQRIEALLGDASDIKDIITLEDELDGRQAELESLEARQRGLTDQVSMSTIELTLTTDPVVMIEEEEPDTFLSGLSSGWDSLAAFLSGALVTFGVLLPWLALLGVIALVALGIVRSRRSRRVDTESELVVAVATAREGPMRSSGEEGIGPKSGD